MWNESAVSASPGSRRLVSILLCLGNHGTGDPLLSPTITCGGNGSASDNGCVFPLHVTTSRDVTVSTEGHRGNPHPVQPITRRRAGSSRRIRRPFPCAEQRSLVRGIPSRDVTDPTFPPQPPIRAQHRWFPLLRPLVLHLYIEEWDPRGITGIRQRASIGRGEGWSGSWRGCLSLKSGERSRWCG